jgi:hypothetical protein
LLIEAGEHGGCAILCACLLAIVDLGIGRLPVSPCRLPRSRLEHQAFGRRRPVLERSAARRSRRQFRDIGKAGAYLAFMRGATIEPRVFQ